MIYLVWERDFGDSGASLVEGPDKADIKSLQKEFRREHETWSNLPREDVDREKYYQTYFYRDGPDKFEGMFTRAFSLWLVDKKGFKFVNHKRIYIQGTTNEHP